jgi:hypothetical protein
MRKLITVSTFRRKPRHKTSNCLVAPVLELQNEIMKGKKKEDEEEHKGFFFCSKRIY